MAREAFVMDGVTYDLAHVEPFTVLMATADATARLLVTFSHHVFTEEWKDGQHDPAHAYTENGDKRCFCPQRHMWSKDLQEIIRYHIAGKCYLGRSSKGIWNNFFYEQRNGRAVPYPVYFQLGYADRAYTVDAVLHVLSAYENADLKGRHNYNPMRFPTLYAKRIGLKKAK